MPRIPRYYDDDTRELVGSNPYHITTADLGGMDAAQLRTEQVRLDEHITHIHQDEDGVPRELSSTEQNEFNRLMALRSRMEQHLRIRETAGRRGGRGIEIAFPQLMTRVSSSQVGPAEVLRLADEQARSYALSMLDARSNDPDLALQSDSLDQADALIRATRTRENPNVDGGYLARRALITESDAYRSAWQQIITDPHPAFTGEEAEALRAYRANEARAVMGEGSGAVGLYGVPVSIDPSIMLTAQQSGSELVEISRLETVTTNAWKGVTSAGVSWSFDAEHAVVSDDSPNDLGQPTVNVGMGRGFIQYSIELGQDYPSFQNEMRRLLEEGWMELLAENLIQGAGTNNGPIGIATALEANTNSQVVLTTAATFTAADIYTIWDQLPKRSRRGATWLTSQATQNKVRQFGSAGAGTADANFTVDLTADSIQRLFGRRYVVDDYMDDVPTSGTAAATFTIVGNFRSFLIARRAGMSVEPVGLIMDTTTGRPTGDRGLFAWARIGSDSIDDGEFIGLLNKTS